MSKRANPAVIGSFIAIGLALGIGAVIVISSSKLFTKTEKYILYFDASVKGLNPGAPVKFRGVTVGSVQDVLIRLNQAHGDVHIPVIIALDEAVIRKKTDRILDLTDEAVFEHQVKDGLRGLLQAQSLVTGVLYVELDILPEAPPPQFHQLKKEYKEIPTVPTQLQMVIEKFADLDLKTTLERMNAVLATVDAKLNELNVAEINHGFTNLLVSVNGLLRSPGLTNSLASLHSTLDEYRLLSEKVRAKLDPLADGADGTLKEAQETLVELRQSLQNLRDLVAPQAPLRREVGTALDELADAARSIGALADFLTRNPNALISGRKQPKP